jgi:hypothetical protein
MFESGEISRGQMGSEEFTFARFFFFCLNLLRGPAVIMVVALWAENSAIVHSKQI